MKRSNKRLSHIFIRELVYVRNILEDMGGFDVLECIDPRLVALYISVDSLLEWADHRFNMKKESKNFDKYEEYIDLIKYSGDICYDCETENMEYYMVKNSIWNKYGANEYQLCISCLEKRMGRKLEVNDFINCMVNDECEYVENLRKDIIQLKGKQ